MPRFSAVRQDEITACEWLDLLLLDLQENQSCPRLPVMPGEFVVIVDYPRETLGMFESTGDTFVQVPKPVLGYMFNVLYRANTHENAFLHDYSQ